MTPRIRTFTQLSRIHDFDERYNYLRLRGEVGETTFGFDRYMNQMFYSSREWKQIRHHVIARDQGCDLAFPGFEIYDRIYIHHMNPMTVADLETGNMDILNPEFLISTTHRTHNAIHYGDSSLLVKPLVDRQQGDTRLW